MTQPYSAGALYSTVEDLLLWDQALYTEKLLKPPSFEALFTPWMSTPDGRQYGYGWYVNPMKGHRNIGHSGSIDGFSGYLSRFPDDRAVFIWLRNVISPAPTTVNQDLGSILLGEKVEPPR
jgi:CubicO group peptidase (beta-lactamase class C family)